MVDVRTVADRRQTVRDGTCTLLSREKATYLSAYRPPPLASGSTQQGWLNASRKAKIEEKQ